jgi:hypothetical protein
MNILQQTARRLTNGPRWCSGRLSVRDCCRGAALSSVVWLSEDAGHRVRAPSGRLRLARPKTLTPEIKTDYAVRRLSQTSDESA